MLELPNITLTSFLIAFAIAFVISIAQGNYASALGCFITVGTILPIKYIIWKKIPVENKKQKVIVIKRK